MMIKACDGRRLSDDAYSSLLTAYQGRRRHEAKICRWRYGALIDVISLAD